MSERRLATIDQPSSASRALPELQAEESMVRPEDFNFENIDILEEELRRSQHVGGAPGHNTAVRALGRTATQMNLNAPRNLAGGGFTGFNFGGNDSSIQHMGSSSY